MRISDASIHTILAALNSLKHEAISNPTMVARVDAAKMEVIAYAQRPRVGKQWTQPANV
jgi:hypothetical protein